MSEQKTPKQELESFVAAQIASMQDRLVMLGNDETATVAHLAQIKAERGELHIRITEYTNWLSLLS